MSYEQDLILLTAASARQGGRYKTHRSKLKASLW
jgi:hypothetical protein